MHSGATKGVRVANRTSHRHPVCHHVCQNLGKVMMENEVSLATITGYDFGNAKMFHKHVYSASATRFSSQVTFPLGPVAQNRFVPVFQADNPENEWL
jgi:hypothetical protein